VGDDEAGTSFFSKEGIRAYVASLTDYAGLTGTLTCDEFGDCGSPFVSISQLEDGVFVDIYTNRP
jgi:branched-chain amino acid transport system substrate-binding protein